VKTTSPPEKKKAQTENRMPSEIHNPQKKPRVEGKQKNKRKNGSCSIGKKNKGVTTRHRQRPRGPAKKILRIPRTDS